LPHIGHGFDEFEVLEVLFEFFLDETLDVRLEVFCVGDGNVPRLGDEELALEVPLGALGARLGLEELPQLGGLLALDLAQLHHDAGKVLFPGELGNGLVRFVLLPGKLPRGESKDHELVAVLLVELYELLVFLVG